MKGISFTIFNLKLLVTLKQPIELISVLAASIVASISLHPLQLWKARRQAFPQVKWYFSLRKKVDSGSSVSTDDGGDPQDCFIEHFGWKTFCIFFRYN